MGLDQSQDISGTDLHRLTGLYPPPDFVKQASHDAVCGDPENIPSHLYADPNRRLYPCHTPAATWMSAAFFFDKRASHDAETAVAIETKLLSVADYFGIRGQVDELSIKIAANGANELTQLPDDDFAIIWRFENGTTERHWPMRNATEVKLAAHRLLADVDSIAYDDAHTIANRILVKAVKFGAAIDNNETLEKVAGFGACSARDVIDACQRRVKLAAKKFPEESQELAKLAEIIEQNVTQASGNEQLVKLAATLDLFDRGTQLNKLYGEGGLERPYETLFHVTQKVANEFVRSHIDTTTGRIYDLASLEKIGTDTLREWMGDEFVDAVTIGGVSVDAEKLAAVIPTLDRGAASMFDRMADAMKVVPVMNDKSASAGALSGEKLFEYANAHTKQAVTDEMLGNKVSPVPAPAPSMSDSLAKLPKYPASGTAVRQGLDAGLDLSGNPADFRRFVDHSMTLDQSLTRRANRLYPPFGGVKPMPGAGTLTPAAQSAPTIPTAPRPIAPSSPALPVR